MSNRIVQLVPDLQAWGGVSSFAIELASALEDGAGIRTRFVTANPGVGADGPRDEHRLSARDADALAVELADGDGSPILLHYVNYGYAKRGCPRWLVDGFERWRTARPRQRLVTIFHELYATGLPWQSSFWLSPMQRRLAARMQRLSDSAVTSLERYSATLRSWQPGTHVATLPVFSTVGEPSPPPPLSKRRPRMVVFGSAGLRDRAYAAGAATLLRASTALGVEEIVDVGPGHVAPRSVGQIAVRALGEQPTPAVSALLAESLAGFLWYPADFLSKSTVFAALCAHRIVPVCSWHRYRGSQPDERFWNPSQSDRADWQATADAAHEWYQAHGLQHHVMLYSSLLQ